MAANEVKLTIRIAEDGKNLDIIAKKSREAASGIEKVSDATEKVNKSRNRFSKQEKGVAGLTSNSTKAFAKQTQGITGGLVPAYATLAANVFALSAAFNFFKNAADLRLLEESQVAYANNTGVALQSITQRLREASDGLLGFREAGQAAAIGLAKGFSPSQLEALAEGARKASTALGRNFEDSFDRLIRGASKAEPELLDELGITLRLETATRRYADALGLQADQLTETQRSQAVLLETQRQLDQLFGGVEAASNPFVKLAKTLEDIVRTATRAVLPVFEGLADVINKSGSFAIATFGLLALNIFKAAIPMDAIKEKFEGIEQASKDSLEGSKKALDEYKQKIKETTAELEKSRIASAKSQARDLMKAGENVSGSALVQRVRKGIELTPLQRGQLKKMLNDAEKQYLKHGEIVKNTFKGVNIDLVRGFRTSLDSMDKPAASFFTRMGQRYTVLKLRAEQFNATISRGLTVAWTKAAGAAAKFGAAANAALRFAGFIGILTMVYELIQTIARSPFSIAMGIAKALDAASGFFGRFVNFAGPLFLGFVDSIINAFNSVTYVIKQVFFGGLRFVFEKIDGLINGTVRKINNMIETFNKVSPTDLPLIELQSSLKDLVPASEDITREVSNLAGGWKDVSTSYSTFEDALRASNFGKTIFQFQQAREATLRSAEALEKYRDALKSTQADLNNIVNGIAAASSQAEAGEKIAQGILSLGVSGRLLAINAKTLVTALDGTTSEEYVMNMEDRKAATDALIQSLGGLGALSPQLKKALEDGSVEGIQALETQASSAVGSLAGLNDGIQIISQEVGRSLGSGNFLEAEIRLVNLSREAENAANAFNRLGSPETAAAAIAALEKFNTSLGKDVNAREFTDRIISLREAQEKLEIAQQTALFTGKERQAILKIENDLIDTALKLEANLLAQKVATNAADKIALAQEERRLQVRRALLQVQKIEQEQGQFSATAAQTGALVAPTAAALDTGSLSEQLDALQSFTSPMRESIKQLGPEGEALQAAAAGALFLAETYASAFEKIKAGSFTLSDGLGVLASTVTALGSIQAAQSKAAISGIENQIAAEKARDGKSKESVDKIRQLENKKEQMKRKAFEQDKKMKLAQAIIGTAQGVTNALGGAPPPFNFVLAGLVAAMGAAQIGIIQGSSYQGGGASSAQAAQPSSVSLGQRTSAVNLAQAKSPTGELAYLRGSAGTGGPENFQPSNAFAGMKYRANGGNTGVMVGEQGPELFVPDRPGRIVPSDEVQQSSVSNINFSINAVDAAGVEEVLINQRGNIIGMLREAANAHGQEFLEAVDVSVYAAPDRRTL